MRENISQDQDIEWQCLRYKNIAEMGKYSLEMEDKREQSVISQAGQMLSAISLFSAGLLMITPIILEYTSFEPACFLFLVGVVGVEILFSLSMAILAQWRYKTEFMLTAKEIDNEVEEKIKKIKVKERPYQYQYYYDYQWIAQISAVHKSKRINDNKRVWCLIASMASFLLSITTLLMGVFIIALR